LIKRASLANQDGSRNTHDYNLLPVLCQKLWHYSNMCINNDYFVNKLSMFVFQNISIVTNCNSILNDIFVSDTTFAYCNMKMAGTGATFPSTPGAQRVLETSVVLYDSRCKQRLLP
jgi:hypothetical protein